MKEVGEIDRIRAEYAELSLKADALQRERDAIGAALGEPCAECGHIDWRSDGYLDDLLSPVRQQYEAAQREADIQLGEKLAAQMTLKAVCDALVLPMVSLGNGWTEATPKILARIEEIVDEAERGFRERDELNLQNERLGTDFVELTEQLKAANRNLALVRRMARYGVGPDTTPQQVLETIGTYIERQECDSAEDGYPEGLG